MIELGHVRRIHLNITGEDEDRTSKFWMSKKTSNIYDDDTGSSQE